MKKSLQRQGTPTETRYKKPPVTYVHSILLVGVFRDLCSGSLQILYFIGCQVTVVSLAGSCVPPFFRRWKLAELRLLENSLDYCHGNLRYPPKATPPKK